MTLAARYRKRILYPLPGGSTRTGTPSGFR